MIYLDGGHGDKEHKGGLTMRMLDLEVLRPEPKWSFMHPGHDARIKAHTDRIRAELVRRADTPESRQDLTAKLGRLVPEYT